jgi:hypothetical protein
MSRFIYGVPLIIGKPLLPYLFVTPPTVLRVLAPFLVATHTGQIGVVIEKVFALLVVGMHDGNFVVRMALSAILLLVVVSVIVVTSDAVIFHPGTVGCVIENDESPLALVNNAHGFLGRGLCVVIVKGNNARDQAGEEQKKRYLVRPGSSHGSFLTATTRLRKCQEPVPWAFRRRILWR